jgi:hypothetical protein
MPCDNHCRRILIFCSSVSFHLRSLSGPGAFWLASLHNVVKELRHWPSNLRMVQRYPITDSWDIRHVDPDRGVSYGQLRKMLGKTVKIAYARVNAPMQLRVTYETVVWIGKRNSTRPAKKRKTEMCKRVGIVATARAIPNLRTPSNIYARIRPRL